MAVLRPLAAEQSGFLSKYRHRTLPCAAHVTEEARRQNNIHNEQKTKKNIRK
jgi:hypothetical protein